MECMYVNDCFIYLSRCTVLYRVALKCHRSRSDTQIVMRIIHEILILILFLKCFLFSSLQPWQVPVSGNYNGYYSHERVFLFLTNVLHHFYRFSESCFAFCWKDLLMEHLYYLLQRDYSVKNLVWKCPTIDILRWCFHDPSVCGYFFLL